MRRIEISALTVLLMIATTPAQGGEPGNFGAAPATEGSRSAFVEQIGEDNLAEIAQTQFEGAAFGTSLLPREFLTRLSGAAGGRGAVVAQIGSGNTASIRQSADRSQGEIGQFGDGNLATVLQHPLSAGDFGNRAGVYQDGSDNAALVAQDGAGNFAALSQTGDGLSGEIRQTNADNSARLTQEGTGLAYAIVQDGVITQAGEINLTGVKTVSVHQTMLTTQIEIHE